MTQNPINTKSIRRPVQSDRISIRKLILILARKWYIFLITLLISSAGAYFYIKFESPTFLVSSTILIEEGERVGVPGADQLMQGFGLLPGAQNMENQIEILSSRYIFRKTLEELPFEIDCYSRSLFKKVSYFPLNLIDVIPHSEANFICNQEFTLEDTGSDYYYYLAGMRSLFERSDTIGVFGNRMDFMGGSFTIDKNPDIVGFDNNKRIYFIVHDLESLVEQYRERIKIEKTSSKGSIIKLRLEGTNKAKDIVFLNKLTEVFMANNLEKKNIEAKRVIEFIDEQLGDVSDSLTITENQLQEFRSQNRIVDISAQAQQIIDQAVELDNEKAKLTLELSYYEYLTDYLSEENNQEVPISPATMGIEDPLLSNLMQELAGLQAEYFSSGGGERNPLQGQLELQIQNAKQSIRETLQGIMGANKMALRENVKLVRKLNNEASRLPEKERQLLGIERKFNLNNVLYTFLLQKRAEAQIQRASNKPDNELIDQASADRLPVAPNIPVVYLLSVCLGLGIPFGVIVLADLLNTKISSEEELKLITNLPITGYIPHSKLIYQTIVLNEPQSHIAEAFRSIRARMQYFIADTKCPVILVTSSIPGEGKTFTSVNLASIYSLSRKRTILIGFDLRRPNLSTDFELSNEKGLSSYLIGKSPLVEVIHTTQYENLDIIPVGAIPPNPAELIDSEKTRELIANLKTQYDYIICDSAPIGTVSDCYPLATLADATLLVVRHDRSMKRPLEATLAEFQANGFKGISILVNDFKLNKGSYINAYKYKYGYNYK